MLAATVGASGLAMLDATTVQVALPAIGHHLRAGIAGLQWTVNAYTLFLASLLCAAAPTVETLIAARAFQGVGGALLTPGNLAILQASFAAGDRGRAVGAWSGLGGIAAAIGPLLGGWLVDANLLARYLPVGRRRGAVGHRAPRTGEPVRYRHRAGARFDVAGAALGALGLAAFTWALIAAGDPGRSPVVWAAGAAGVLALVGFLWVERRTRAPLVPLELFASRQFSAVNLVTFVVYGGMAGLFFLLVIHLQQVAGYSPLLDVLIRLTGDFELAEDALQEAFAQALVRWPADGQPRKRGRGSQGSITTAGGGFQQPARGAGAPCSL